MLAINNLTGNISDRIIKKEHPLRYEDIFKTKLRRKSEYLNIPLNLPVQPGYKYFCPSNDKASVCPMAPGINSP